MEALLGRSAIARSLLHSRKGLLIAVLLALGVLVRFYHYGVVNRSLWHDESGLALNIVDSPVSELWGALKYLQKAPFGFLMLEKGAVEFFGPGEKALRLAPFLYGIASIFLFFGLVRRWLTGVAVPVAIGLFVFCPALIMYSHEVKEYSGDVFWTLLILLLSAKMIDQTQPERGLLTLALVGSVAIWFSFPVVFVLAGIGLQLGYRAVSSRDMRYRLKVVSVGLIWLASFVPSFIAGAAHLHQSTEVIRNNIFLTKSFAPLPITSLGDVRWYFRQLPEVFMNPVGVYAGLGGFLFLLGMASFIEKKRAAAWLIMSPALFSLIASAWTLYPFSGRFLLFLIPSLVLVMAIGLRRVWDLLVHCSRPCLILGRLGVVGFLLVEPLGVAVASAVNLSTTARSYYHKEEIRPVLEGLIRESQPDDIVYVHHGAKYAFHYYRRFYPELSKLRIVEGEFCWYRWHVYEDELGQFRGLKRVWILSSHIALEERRSAFFLTLDRQGGLEISRCEAKGALAILYDFTTESDRHFEKEAP